MPVIHRFARLLLALTLACPAYATAQNAEKPAAKPAAAAPLAKVNGVNIPRHRLDTLVRDRLAQGATDSVQLRTALRDDLINRELIAQDASRSGFSKRAEFQAELELVRQTYLVQSFVRDWLRRNPVSDADIQKEYDSTKANAGDTEYKARHILVDGEDEAKAVIAELKKGASFDDLAKQKSKDPGSKERGGDLDWQVPGTYDRVFADAMVKLSKGQVTEAPVHTRFGYHVIRLDDTRTVKFPPLAEVRGRIQQQLSQRKVEEYIRTLRAKAKIE